MHNPLPFHFEQFLSNKKAVDRTKITPTSPHSAKFRVNDTCYTPEKLTFLDPKKRWMFLEVSESPFADSTEPRHLNGTERFTYLKTHEKFKPNPIGSMYGIFTYIYHTNYLNVGEYTMHGSYGNVGKYSSPIECLGWGFFLWIPQSEWIANW